MEFLAFSDIWDWIELVAMILGILFVIFQIQQKVAMWYFDIFCALAYVAIGIHQHLWGSMTLNAYYFLISFLGIYRLQRDKALAAGKTDGDSQDAVVVRPLPRSTVIASALIFIVSAVALYFILVKLDDPQPALDSATMTLSFIGTYWLTNSHIQHWFIWMVADSMQAAMFALQGMYAPSLMFLVYLAASFYGYEHWRRHKTVIE